MSKPLDSKTPILLVEDDEIDVEGFRRSFKKLNMPNKLHVAEDGIKALDMLYGKNRQEKIEVGLVLLDISMPRMNGIEFLKELRKNTDFDNLVIFVFTSSKSQKDILASYQFNVTGYIVKPIRYLDFNIIVKELKRYLNSSQTEIPSSFTREKPRA